MAKTIIRKGIISGVNYNELLVRTKTNEPLKFTVLNNKEREGFFDNYVRITIEVIDKTEYDKSE